ncbi:MAG: hypothetical protein P4L82_12950 [Ancalomicrobiaceae bacterium]|nr:hypothetical protein [Ancalomicrobiaceae bacterium]
MNIGNILWRLVVIAFGLLVALAGSAGMLIAAFGGRAFSSVEASRPFSAFLHVIDAVFLLVGLAGASLPVWLVAVLVGEALAWRRLVYYLATGAVSGGLAAVVPGAVPASHDLALSVATGLAAGLIYWAIAGRRAGAWGPEKPGSGAPSAPNDPTP